MGLEAIPLCVNVRGYRCLARNVCSHIVLLMLSFRLVCGELPLKARNICCRIVLLCFVSALTVSEVLPLCGEEYLLTCCFADVDCFRFVSEVLPLYVEKYLFDMLFYVCCFRFVSQKIPLYSDEYFLQSWLCYSCVWSIPLSKEMLLGSLNAFDSNVFA